MTLENVVIADEDHSGKRKIKIDLTPTASAEIERLKEVTGLSTADLFRHALDNYQKLIDHYQAKGKVNLISLDGKTQELKRDY